MGVSISVTGKLFMTIKLNPQTKVTMLDPGFVSVVNNLLKDTSIEASEVIAMNFRDPNYSAENGGYHPVEIHIDSAGEILSITDFAYFGVPPFVELGIELDWSFEQDYFRQFDNMFDLECGRSLLGLYTSNFTAYYKSGVYEVEVTPL
jgi:hypothetical protein